jgi:UDP-glucose 4-epimerase
LIDGDEGAVNMARVLITGGAGFIGSHTARRLLDLGEEVAVYDFFHQYVFPIQPTFLENMQYRFDVLLKGAHILRGSTHNKDELRRQVMDIGPDYIIHLAALPLANIALRQTEEAFDSIVAGTVNMLEILRDMSNVQKFVYVSSSMVYGDFAQVPMPEDGAKDPKEIYGGMKLAGEILVRVFSRRYGIPYVIVRPSAVYGPTDNNRRVLQIFVESAIRGQPITAVNPDTTFLDFSYVEDVAQGMQLITLSANVANEDLNVTRGEARSLAEAVEILRARFPDLEVSVKTEAESYRPNRGTLDIDKARRLVGYNPSHSLEAGLAKYVDFILAHNRSLFRDHP